VATPNVAGMVLLNSPAIAALCWRGRQWAHKRMRRGSFGPTVEHGGVVYATLAGVEDYAGRAFSREQIDRAIDGKPTRQITIQSLQEEP
jgi:hypothetical protein